MQSGKFMTLTLYWISVLWKSVTAVKQENSHSGKEKSNCRSYIRRSCYNVNSTWKCFTIPKQGCFQTLIKKWPCMLKNIHWNADYIWSDNTYSMGTCQIKHYMASVPGNQRFVCMCGAGNGFFLHRRTSLCQKWPLA